MRTVLCLCFLGTPVCFLAGAFPCFGQKQLAEKSSGQKDPLDMLASPKLADRVAGEKAEIQARERRIQALLTIAQKQDKKPQFYGSRLYAIRLLGEYRAAQAVDFLVENVSLNLPALASESFLGGHECARALIQIGNPSIEGISRRLSKPCEELEIKLFAYVLGAIDGKEISKHRLELAEKEAENLATVDGPVRRQNIKKLLEQLK